MRHINKVLSYFSSAYVNSTRYNHSTSGWLQIIFERNNKYKSTVANLGTVFKNSKWTDFKSQNIKESLIKDWVFIIATLLFIFFSYCILLGLLRSDSLLRSIPLVNKLIEVITELWVPFTNYVDYIFACLGSYYVYILFEFRQKFLNNQASLLDNCLVIHNQPKDLAPLNPSNLLKVKNSKSTSEKVNVLRTVNNLNHTLNLSQASAEDFNFKVPNSGALSLIKDFKTKVWFVTLKNNFSVSDGSYHNPCEAPYTLIAGDEVMRLTLNPYTTSQLQKDVQFIPSNLNIMNQLSLAKQDRWFLKNSLLGDSLTKSTSNFTQAKKLIASGSFANNTSNNVWLSSKAGSLNSAEALNFAMALNKSVSSSAVDLNTLSFNNINNSQINFFEDSRFFFSKRYFFLNQLKSNMWESQNIQTSNLVLATLPVTTQMPLIYTKSLLLNLDGLVTTQYLNSDQAKLIDYSQNDISLSLTNNTMLDSSSTNFINKLTTLSTDTTSNVLLTKITAPINTTPLENSFLEEENYM